MEETKVSEVVFSQSQVDSMIAEQRRQDEAKAAKELEAERARSEEVRRVSAAALAAQRGTTNTEQFLIEQANLVAKNTQELATIQAILSDGKRSQALFKSDPTTWRAIVAKRDKILGREAKVIVPQGKAFRNNNT